MHMLVVSLHTQLEVFSGTNAHACSDATYVTGRFNGTMHMLVVSLHTQLNVFNGTMYMLVVTLHT